MTSILTESQRRILTTLSGERSVTQLFYLTGGTALSEYYLQHRYSEDLDFFSETEFEPAAITAILKKIGKAASIAGMRYEQSFNRNIFFLETAAETIKVEFTYFPFPRIEKGRAEGSLEIDSLIDIAVNKVFTIFQKPRARDFTDLYCILQREREWSLESLVEKAQIKFDTHIDPLQLGAQFIRAEEVKDFPRMLEPLEPYGWQRFFLDEAKKLRPHILE